MTLSGRDVVLPRIGFVGLGWIGRLRLEAVEAAGTAMVAALCDRDVLRLNEASSRNPGATTHTELEDLLASPDLDAIVLATPNAMHAPQALMALGCDLPLFVQKPMGLDRSEVASILEMARIRDRLVAVDWSYRFLEGACALRDWVHGGELGRIHLAEATFHNAYGPDKAWCFDPSISGGGALLDLGVHLLDLLFWMFGPTSPGRLDGWTRDVEGRPGIDQLAGINFELDPGLRVRLTASWHAHAGRDCDFRLTLHGTRASAELRNVEGSFYDFELARRTGRSEQVVVRDSRRWMDGAVLEWIDGVAAGKGYDPAAETSLAVAEVVDRVYGTRGRAQSVPARPTAERSSGLQQKVADASGAQT